MLYAIWTEDVADSAPLRAANREAHLAYLKPLLDAGRIVLAGPLPAVDAEDPGPAGMAGSLIVAEFDSLAEAEAWAEGDPYRQAGVFRSVTVRPFRKVVP